MNLLITLCARGGSKGIPGKNVRIINGQPLIALSINIAEKFAALHKADITLSTDDDTIKKVASDFGLKTKYLRPNHLATDAAGKIPTIHDVLDYEEKVKKKRYDFILDLDVTSPLRTMNDLNAAFEMVNRDTEALNIFSVNPANKNPYFNMVEKQENGYFGLVKKGIFLTRQSAPAVYDMNASFYFYRRSFFDLEYASSITNKSLIYIMPHICFDLDHEIDFDFMTYLIEKKKIDFEI